MKKQIILLVVLTLILSPSGVLAMKDMDHGSMDKEAMDHSKMEGEGGHSGMDMGGEMIMLQEREVDDVLGSAHLMDVKEKMAEHGMGMTHHIMVGFIGRDSMAIREGQVAVKIKSPDGKTDKPIKMMGMHGQFGADITLDQKGAYQFIIGTKLADGKKRTFQFHYDN